MYAQLDDIAHSKPEALGLIEASKLPSSLKVLMREMVEAIPEVPGECLHAIKMKAIANRDSAGRYVVDCALFPYSRPVV